MRVDSVMHRARRTALALALGVSALVAAPAAAVHCSRTGGPPANPVTLTLDVTYPANGAVLPAVLPCERVVNVTGTFDITGTAAPHDFYVVIDGSGSTAWDSATDVDQDGVLHEQDDTIYRAEIAAARAFVAAVDPSFARVAVIRFSRFTQVVRTLTSDLAAVDAALVGMQSDPPDLVTRFVPAIDAVSDEVVARGSRPARQQVCLFISDGMPEDQPSAIHAAAQALADLGVVIDTFQLGGSAGSPLEDMAATGGGTFTQLIVPGSIVSILPTFAPQVDHGATWRNVNTGQSGPVTLDETNHAFSVPVTLVPGPNRIVISLIATAVPLTLDCPVDVTLQPGLMADAGPAHVACDFANVVLDARGSRTVGCTTPMYQWLDCHGLALGPPSVQPMRIVPLDCVDCTRFTLVLSCAGSTCTATDDTNVTCMAAPTLAPALVDSCGNDVELACGASPTATSWWDLDSSVDSSGDGDPDNDVDVSGCDVSATLSHGGAVSLAAWTRDPASGCNAREFLRFWLGDPLPRNLDGGVCPTEMVDFSCGTPDPLSTYWWDFDTAVDSDGDGDPARDVDALGCDVVMTWPFEEWHDVAAWRQRPSGCTTLVGSGHIDVTLGARPGDVPGLLVTRDGGIVRFTWSGVPGASTYRLLRGAVSTLWVRRGYDHVADDSVGAGSCDLGRVLSTYDLDDLAAPGDFYYLVTGVTACGGEGTTGRMWNGHFESPRAPRMPTDSCP